MKSSSVLSWVRRLLFAPSEPLWRYCLLAWPLALVPSAFLVSIALSGLSWLKIENISLPDTHITLAGLISSVVIAPLLETFLLMVILRLVMSLRPHPPTAAVISAILWASLHALIAVAWFFGTIWSFFVFSCGYLAWRKKSVRSALIAAAVPHALVNLTAKLGLLLVQQQ